MSWNGFPSVTLTIAYGVPEFDSLGSRGARLSVPEELGRIERAIHELELWHDDDVAAHRDELANEHWMFEHGDGYARPLGRLLARPRRPLPARVPERVEV